MKDKSFLSKAVTDTVLSRRSFIKWNAALGGTAVLMKGGLSPSARPDQAAARADEKIVWSACVVTCGSRCPQRLHVGMAWWCASRRTTPAMTSSAAPGSLLRARADGPPGNLQRRRLQVPMKRVGKRGEGKFEQISWEEAFD